MYRREEKRGRGRLFKKSLPLPLSPHSRQKHGIGGISLGCSMPVGEGLAPPEKTKAKRHLESKALLHTIHCRGRRPRRPAKPNGKVKRHLESKALFRTIHCRAGVYSRRKHKTGKHRAIKPPTRHGRKQKLNIDKTRHL